MGFNITALKQEEPLGESNIFSKQELLEIDNLAKNVETNTVEIFSTDPIQIPISKSLSFEKSVNCEPQLTPYLFLPSVVDLSYWCSAIEDQGSINSCTAFAASGLIEYFANKSQGKYTDVSPMFLYKAARNLMNVTGDVGASLRETMKAIALFGVPPEEFWKYEEDRVEDEPPAFCYSYAQNYQSLKYFRLDYAGISKETLLFQLKAVLAAGFPCMFGFTIYSSVYDEFNIHKGYIPFPDAVKDQVVGGHAVVAVGYDDFKEIPQADSKLISQGALLIRNSWGREWGCKGYGWLPYDYLLQGLTRDWWSLLKTEWFEADNFGFGARNFGVEDKNSDQP
ncbi:peptidase C1A papain [Crinalium epipsammum PCC 9333]|uniref:Peptidase C1A papain n=1 Tax=Crinalium epipsammum PCC 9333 TaxID=1173022 RepID=K9W2W2_9CYAN|nr:C1 family peptidase [Crinalium epipsammum]AFZ14082.1 peptidase C1A papain [Crinalium epipsammum PCC 9333]